MFVVINSSEVLKLPREPPSLSIKYLALHGASSAAVNFEYWAARRGGEMQVYCGSISLWDQDIRRVNTAIFSR